MVWRKMDRWDTNKEHTICSTEASQEGFVEKSYEIFSDD